MKGHYLRISPEVLAHVSSRPTRLDELLIPTLKNPQGDAIHLNIDKSWHAIHYLLNGNGGCGISPLSDAVMGGTPIGDEEFGYGPPRGLTPGEVRKVSLALTKIPVEKLMVRYDADAMIEAEIYPNAWEDTTEDRSNVADHYIRLTMFFRDAADAGDAMILYVA